MRTWPAREGRAARALERRVVTECVSWRWRGNLGDDMIFAAQEALFGAALELGQWYEKPDAVLVGGGTFVPKFPEHPELVPLSRRLPTAFFGTGIGDPVFWGREHISAWLEVLANARFVGVRGPLSQERLEAWGVSTERVAWVGDPALYFADRGRRPLRFGGRLAVNLGTVYGRLYGFDERRLETAIVQALRELRARGWGLTLVCAWPPDDEVLERVAAAVPVEGIAHWHDDYRRALDEVAAFDLVLSEKLHVAVVAACRAVPFVALNYRSKVLDFCRSIGWEELCLTTEALEADAIVEGLTRLARAPGDWSARLEASVAGVRRRLLGAAGDVLAALAEGGG